MRRRSFRDRAILLLSGLEEGREVRSYLHQFSQQTEGCFAVIKVGGAIVERDLDTLAESLALLQALGLPPIVVYGAGPQLDQRLASAGFEEKRVDGLRYTPEKAMPLVAAAAGQMGHDLSAAMRRFDGAGMVVHPGTVHVSQIDAERYGMVGQVDHVDKNALSQLVAAGAVPLVSCVHPDKTGQLLNVNADGVARAIAKALQPQKIVFLTGTGGILDEKGNVISSINLALEKDKLFASPWLSGGMHHKLTEIDNLLAELPYSSSVSITTTEAMIRELFTHTGSGTLVRRGEFIRRLETATAEDFHGLIEDAFHKELKPDYFSRTTPLYSLLSEQKRAGAIVTQVEGHDFLDKFAVSRQARGEGLAVSLWKQLLAASPELLWRSRHDNSFNAFYHAHADGSVRRGPWTVFWVGRSLEQDISRLADQVAQVPGDFVGEE